MMAKRMRLNTELNNDGMEKLLHLHRLLEIPEANKLRLLDEEMSRTATSNDLPVDAKIRKFEENLAEYRQVLERIKRHGGTSILDQNYDTIVKKIVDAVLEGQTVQKNESAGGQALRAKESVEDQVALKEEPVEGKDLLAEDSMDEEGTIFEDSSIGEEDGKQLRSMLEKRGVVMTEKQVQFPEKGNARRKTYARSSLNKVMKFMTSELKEKPQSKLEQLTDLVFNLIVDDIDDEMLRKYPNLSSLYISKKPVLRGEWLEMK